MSKTPCNKQLHRRCLSVSTKPWHLITVSINLLILQGEAIAVNLREMFGFRVPILSVVIGEGGSGGALAIGCANRNLIMEHSVYYVASPEACAAILWKARDKAATVSCCCCQLATQRIAHSLANCWEGLACNAWEWKVCSVVRLQPSLSSNARCCIGLLPCSAYVAILLWALSWFVFDMLCSPNILTEAKLADLLVAFTISTPVVL